MVWWALKQDTCQIEDEKEFNRGKRHIPMVDESIP